MNARARAPAAEPRPEFPDDHPCESLRGYPVPERSRMRRVIAERCAWLERRIAENTATGRGASHHLLELAALVALEAEWSEQRRRRLDAIGEIQRAINAAADDGEISEVDATRLYDLAAKLGA